MVCARSDVDEVGALAGVGLGVGAVLSCSSGKQNLRPDETYDTQVALFLFNGQAVNLQRA